MYINMLKCHFDLSGSLYTSPTIKIQTSDFS